MRIQSLSANPITNKYQNSQPKKKLYNPQFKGREYDIKMHSGGTGYGPGCEIISEGKVLADGRASMYEGHTSAVSRAVSNIHPGNWNLDVQQIKDCYPTGKIYMADPEETITQAMYDKYNYIITERTPRIPTLNDFDRKFHTYIPDGTDYNNELGKIKGYYNRMLKADTKERARYEIRQVEDNINLKSSMENKMAAESRLRHAHPLDRPSYQKEVDQQNYYIYANQQLLKEDSEKIGYYKYKNGETEKKIEFLDNLANIINKTGDALIRRDIIAHERYKHLQNFEKDVAEHIEIMHQLRLKEAEKEYLEKQIKILNKRDKDITNQADKNNREASRKRYSTGGVINKPGVSRHYEEVREIKETIQQIDAELNNLNNTRHQIQKDIIKNKREIKRYTEEIRPIIKNIEPIYQELKTYYEANYPFNK